MKRAIVFGTGDFARVASFYLEHDSPYRVAAFVVDSAYRTTNELLGRPVVSWERVVETHPPSDFALFPAIGYSGVNRHRATVFARAKAAGYELPGYVSSKASCLGAVGEGSFVFEGCVIQPFASVGANVVLWSGAQVAHDSVVGDHVFMAPHAVLSGNCRVGDRTFIGANATVRDRVTIGADCVIGAGALVLHDVPDGAVVKGAESLPAELRSDQLRRI
jgi:sugar O-acyltransferase (sialic acid O-acetyltransferase NeuD family)